ncbi:MAG: hypothetical protein JWR81_6703 [Pseudonocardia sp.]|nr:hypothetical protein [Pseudonocardia sp.]MDT7613661.1 hypothetical protein [Pseudonocardiales bacterium]
MLVAVLTLTGGSAPDPATQIRACESAHQLSTAVARTQPTESRTDFASCTWPPAPPADPDGFTVISSVETDMPGGTEATGDDFVDRITGPCSQFRLAYTFGSQVALQHLPAFVVPPDTITTVENPGPAFAGTLPFTPPRGEVDIVRSGRYELDEASCSLSECPGTPGVRDEGLGRSRYRRQRGAPRPPLRQRKIRSLKERPSRKTDISTLRPVADQGEPYPPNSSATAAKAAPG